MSCCYLFLALALSFSFSLYLSLFRSLSLFLSLSPCLSPSLPLNLTTQRATDFAGASVRQDYITSLLHHPGPGQYEIGPSQRDLMGRLDRAPNAPGALLQCMCCSVLQCVAVWYRVVLLYNKTCHVVV